MKFSASVLGLVNAALSMLLAFGVNVTEAQTAAITGFVNALLILAAFVYDAFHKPSPSPTTV